MHIQVLRLDGGEQMLTMSCGVLSQTEIWRKLFTVIMWSSVLKKLIERGS